MDMKFKYIFDPLFLFSITLYSINKCFFSGSENWNYAFCNYYLNDLLLVPVLVPIILFLSRILKFREYYSYPKYLEIVIPLVIWSVAFEIIGPFYFTKGTSDPIDVLVYCIGGLISWIIWHQGTFVKSFFRK